MFILKMGNNKWFIDFKSPGFENAWHQVGRDRGGVKEHFEELQKK